MEKFFKLKENGTSVKIEFIAGTQVEDPAADLLLRQAVTAGGTLYLEEDEGQLVLSPLT